MKKIIAFNYFGGKYRHVDWVISHLPETKIYVEPFGGSAVILLNKNPSKIEAYNDISSVVYNFFLALREHKEELIEKIYHTPYSQEEYQKCYQNMNVGDVVERARRFFVVVNQSFNGTYARQTGWKSSTKKSRAIITEAVNRWLTKIPNLDKAEARLRQVQIFKLDFKLIFEKFDCKEVLFYCDPPYMHETRCNNNEYDHELTTDDHLDLLRLCKKANGKIAISSYESDLYNKQLKNFYKSKAKKKRNGLLHSQRQEVLWTNYDPDSIHNHSLFESRNE